MTATAQAITQPSNNHFNSFPLGRRTVARHVVGWTVAWWFFAKILPIFVNVGAGLGFPVSTLGLLLDGMSHYATVGGPWLIPVCLIVDWVVGFAAQRIGGRLWFGRWTLAVEVFLFAAVVLAMWVFFRPLLPIWVAGGS